MSAFTTTGYDEPIGSLQAAMFINGLDPKFDEFKMRLKNDVDQMDVSYPDNLQDAFRKAERWSTLNGLYLKTNQSQTRKTENISTAYITKSKREDKKVLPVVYVVNLGTVL